jgi:hypothetical protein
LLLLQKELNKNILQEAWIELPYFELPYFGGGKVFDVLFSSTPSETLQYQSG